MRKKGDFFSSLFLGEMEASHLNWSGGSGGKETFFPSQVPLLSSSSSSRPPPLPSKRVSKGEEKKKSLVLITNERDEKSSWWLDGQENFVWTSVAIIVNISYNRCVSQCKGNSFYSVLGVLCSEQLHSLRGRRRRRTFKEVSAFFPFLLAWKGRGAEKEKQAWNHWRMSRKLN